MNIEELQTVENIIQDMELPSFQNIGVQKALLNKKMLLAFDTGTGKTYTYSVFVRGLLNNNPESKHIFIIINDSVEQAPNDINNLVNVPTSAFSGIYSDYNRLIREWDMLSIILLTYECFQDLNFCCFLYQHLDEINSIVIDEAHHASNWDISNTAFMIRSFTRYIPYVIALTATPITSKKLQYYQLLNIIDRNLSPIRDETYLEKYNERYMPVNRSDYEIKGNYKTTLEIIKPTINQIGDIKGIISRVIKGTGAVNQVDCLVRIIKNRLLKNNKIIVYVHYHDTRDWVEKHLKYNNIAFVSLHGRISKREERKKILQIFKETDCNILITSVSESLNIDSDVVIFYEFTTKIKQVMGRAHRGLDSKQLELIFLITRDTMEVDFFLKYIYNRSMMIQNLLGKDYSEIINIGQQIKKLNLSDD